MTSKYVNIITWKAIEAIINRQPKINWKLYFILSLLLFQSIAEFNLSYRFKSY